MNRSKKVFESKKRSTKNKMALRMEKVLCKKKYV